MNEKVNVDMDMGSLLPETMTGAVCVRLEKEGKSGKQSSFVYYKEGTNLFAIIKQRGNGMPKIDVFSGVPYKHWDEVQSALMDVAEEIDKMVSKQGYTFVNANGNDSESVAARIKEQYEVIAAIKSPAQIEKEAKRKAKEAAKKEKAEIQIAKKAEALAKLYEQQAKLQERIEKAEAQVESYKVVINVEEIPTVV